ncbi:glycosyltransferase family 4 protein [Martelella endophytica]|uniref:Glycosyl transferase n=1 Tax=Martelella endophytica TaxID=1486262 RepID=A0A0D5LXE8_MAREN|nr:glycosyltransferase family 4 protein [Martelella endophytica]AJY48118.1 hypothetical protein TM49_10575 [Martelella endophytica]
MKTARIMQLLPAMGDGGVERGTLEMAEYLAAKGVENWVVSAGGPLVDALIGTGTHHIEMKVGAKSPASILANAVKLARLIDDHQIDIVHARSRAPAWAGYLACMRARCHPRFLTTFHGVYGHGNRFKRAYNGVMVKAPIIVANSAFIRDHIISVYGVEDDRIIVAPRGVDTNLFNPQLIAPATLDATRAELGGSPLVAIVGRITEWKGHRYLIEAMALAKNRDFHLAIVGSGNDTVIAALQTQIADKGLGDRVRITGSRRDIPAVMAAADLAISSSVRPEAFGRVAIEAQVMGTPVVATAHGGSLETVIDGKTGFLVPPADPQAMADAIDRALAEPVALAEIGAAARRHVLENFTVETMLEKEYAAYQRLMKRD